MSWPDFAEALADALGADLAADFDADFAGAFDAGGFDFSFTLLFPAEVRAVERRGGAARVFMGNRGV